MNVNDYLKKEITLLSDAEQNAVIEYLLKRLLTEFSNQDKSGIYGITQRMTAYNSNKIEGSTLTEKQTASLFETGTIMASGEIFKAKDIEEMTGHFMMFNEMLVTYQEPLSEELIKRYHFRLKSGVFEDMANGYPVGKYKNRKNIVSDIITAAPEQTAQEMERLIISYEEQPVKNIAVLAEFHADYEKIHPFQDGNGRTGRLLLFKECLRHKLIPFIIMDQKKAIYYEALNRAQTMQHYEQLIKIFEQEQEQYYSCMREFLYINE